MTDRSVPGGIPPGEEGAGKKEESGEERPDRPTQRSLTRRRARRKKVFKGARLVLGGGLSTIDCIVKDISIGGARVKVADVTRLGKSLRLVFPDGEALDADVIRDIGLEFGLKFRPGARPSLAPPSDLAEDIAIELESPWLEGLLTRLAASEAGQDPGMSEAVDDLRDAYARLKMLLDRHVTRY